MLSGGIRKLLAIRFTDSSGITEPLIIPTPEPAVSLTPGAALKPYAAVDIQVHYPGFNRILAEGVQVFPGVETVQNLQLQPIAYAPELSDRVISPEPEQNL